MTKLNKQLIAAPFIVLLFVWILLAGVGLTQTSKFKDHNTSCMYVYWVITWPVWKVAPSNWFAEYVMWTANHCDK